MVNRRHDRIALISLLTSFFALCVIGLGAFTRLIDAGLGCPDWPGCYGQLTVPLSETAQQLANIVHPDTPLVIYKAWSEMIHRYFAGALSLLTLGILVLVLHDLIKTSRWTRVEKTNLFFMIVLVLLIIYQIVLGQWTVTLKLLPIIVTQHLLGGFLILTILWLVFLNNKYSKTALMITAPYKDSIKTLLPWAWLAVILVFSQIFLGAWVSTNYASLSCPDFPFCVNDAVFQFNIQNAFHLMSPVGVNYEGGVLPEEVRQTIQMTHRLGALILTVYLFVFSMAGFIKTRLIPAIMNMFLVILGLLLLQLCIGVTNVMFNLPLATAIAHNLVAVMLLLAVVTLLFKLTRVSKLPKDVIK